MDKNSLNNQKEFGPEFRWIVGLISLLISLIMLLSSLGQEPWKYLIPLFFFLVFGACLLPGKVGVWFRRILFAWIIVLVLWGLYATTIKEDIFSLITGAVIGVFFGLIGGVIGGFINGYFSPVTRIMRFDAAGRRKLAQLGARSAMWLGAGAGLILGALIGLVGDHTSPPLAFLVLGSLSEYVSDRLERSAGESIEGLPGALIGGSILGVAGGYTGRFVLTTIFS